jgi:hypothetical protein
MEYEAALRTGDECGDDDDARAAHSIRFWDCMLMIKTAWTPFLMYDTASSRSETPFAQVNNH